MWLIVLMMIGSLAVGIVIFVMLQGGSLGVDDNGGSNCFECDCVVELSKKNVEWVVCSSWNFTLYPSQRGV